MTLCIERSFRSITHSVLSDTRFEVADSFLVIRVGRRQPLRILREQFLSPMILLLLVVIGISVGIRHFTDAAIIGVIVILNAWIGFFQEARAERAMESVRRISAPAAKVVRDGKVMRIPSRELVPGDIVTLESGDRIPADLRFAEAISLQIDEPKFGS